MPSRGLVSNKGVLTAISLKAGQSDIFHITLLPLNEEIRASNEISLLTMKFPSSSDNTLELSESIKLLKGWHKNFNAKISLLGYDLSPKVDILRHWLKDDYDVIFYERIMDIRTLEFFLQDSKAFNGECSFEEPNLTRLASSLGFEDKYAKLPQRECLLLAEVYRRLLHKMG